MLYYHSSTHLHFIFFAVSFLRFIGNIYSEQIFFILTESCHNIFSYRSGCCTLLHVVVSTNLSKLIIYPFHVIKVSETRDKTTTWKHKEIYFFFKCLFGNVTIKYNRYTKNTFFDWYFCQVFRQDGWRWWHVSSCKLFMTFFPCTKIRGVSSFMYYYFYYTLQSRIHLLLQLVFWEPRYRNACKMEHFEFGHNSQNLDIYQGYFEMGKLPHLNLPKTSVWKSS